MRLPRTRTRRAPSLTILARLLQLQTKSMIVLKELEPSDCPSQPLRTHRHRVRIYYWKFPQSSFLPLAAHDQLPFHLLLHLDRQTCRGEEEEEEDGRLTD